MYQLKKLLAKVNKAYRFDPRSLAFLRITIALIIIIDLCIRSSDLTAHYTNEGIWPTRLATLLAWKPYSWSLHTLNGNYYWVLLLFSLHFVFAFFLLLGFRTRLSTILLWLLTISLHNRNLFVLQAGDDLLRLILFWGIFLPWNCCYSLDSFKTKINCKQSSLANLGYLFLIASVYFFTAYLKTSSEWHGEGSAVYYALSLEQMRLPICGDWLYQFPQLMKFLTWVVYGIEIILPILILFPSKKGYTRLTAFILMCILHLGIGLTLYVGLFFLINIASAIALLPSFVLDKIERKLKISRPSKSKVAPSNSYFLLFRNSFLVVVIFLSLIINLGNMSWFKYQLRPVIWYPINALRLDQFWGMFSPSVMKKDGWFVYYGIDSLGRQWDLRLNQDYVDYTKPKHVVRMYANDRWRKMAENMQNNDFTFLRPKYCNYILKKWNKEHPEKKILTLNLYFMEKENLLNYKTTIIKQNLHCVCDGR